jgi:hypothetical protein
VGVLSRLCAIVVLGWWAAMSGCARPPKGFTSPEPAARIAAITEADAKSDRSAIPHLIESLQNDDPVVRMAAIRTLQDMTGQTLGYQYWAGETERIAATRRWEQWYASNGGKAAGLEAANVGGKRTDTGDISR